MKRLEKIARPTWQAQVQAHAAARRRRTGLAVAAMVLLTLGAGFLWQTGLAERFGGFNTQPTVATVEALFTDGSNTAGEPSFQIGSKIIAGDKITVDNERMALRLASGFSVRLDAGTHLTITSADALELHRGAVYVDSGPVDSGPQPNQASLQVHTPYGIARDIGTQFEVRLLDASLRVQVREGEVEIRVDDRLHSALAGTVLTLGDDGSVERGNIARFDPQWDWAAETLPPFTLEDRSIQRFLEWICRETGLELAFADQAAEKRATTITGSGSVEGLSPEDALQVVLPGAGLSFQITDHQLTVSLISKPN